MSTITQKYGLISHYKLSNNGLPYKKDTTVILYTNALTNCRFDSTLIGN